jgi:predicted metal-dependent peptidase
VTGVEQLRLDRTKLLAARLRAARDRPYLATALYALSVVESRAVPTMGVDRRWRCYVSAEFVAAHEVAELAGVWIHEVAHLLRDHHGRADRLPTELRAQHRRVNVAQDCEINDDLLADGVPLPGSVVHPGLFNLPTGRLFEEYLSELPPAVELPCRCGSGASGVPEEWELGEGGPGVRPTEADALRRQTAEGIRAHKRTRGSVPAGWDRWAGTVLEPVVDWRRVLAGAVREALVWAGGAIDYTYRRPGRRTAAMRGVVLPSLRRPVPRVAIVIDTSGSMGDDELAGALGEVQGVLRSVGVGTNRVSVLACDADVHAVRRVSSADQVVLAGGGGTDMRVGIEAATAQPDRPQIVVVLTDGYTPWPAAEPRARVVIGLLGGGNPPATPVWAETVVITPGT